MSSFSNFVTNGIIYVVNFVTALGDFYLFPRITVVGGIDEDVVRLIDVGKRVIGFEVH